MNRSIVTVLAVASLGISPLGAQSTKTPLGPTSVDGRVFVLMKNGDLKPARMAQVFVVSGTQAIADYQYDVGVLLDRLDDAKALTSDARDCAELLATQKVLEKKQEPIVTDEEGVFQTPDIKAGMHQIVAIGKAAGVLCLWRTTVTLRSGQKQVVKLSEPYRTCAASE